MPPSFIEGALFDMKHQGDFANTVLHIEVTKEIHKTQRTIMNTS